MDAQLRQDIIGRFHSDAGFRDKVLADANGAVKSEYGVDLPYPMRVVADGSDYRIEPEASSGDDLSDEQLDMVAGGKGGAPAPAVNKPPQMPRGGAGKMIGNDGQG